LAAGMGSRFGGVKQLAEFNGKALIEMVIDAVPPEAVDGTVVVLGHDAIMVAASAGLAGRKGVRVVVNYDYKSGLGSSIRRGVESLSDESAGVLILLADQPFVSRTLLRRMLRLFAEGDAHGAKGRTRIVAASFGDVVGPPAIFPRRYFRELMSLEGDQGARSVLGRHKRQVLRFDLRTGRAMRDFDTREALDRATARSHQGRRDENPGSR
jgi:molybdenum cofactor cytidylyltransferase